MKTKFMLLIIIICHLSLNAVNRGQLIESFDDAQTELFTYQNFDNVNYWEHSSTVTYNGSPYSLYLKGNNSKYMMTDSIFTDGSTVWSLAARVNQTGNAIAFGVGDGTHSLIYIIKGSAEADSMNWVEDYQGVFPNNEWCQYLLPLGEDWYARFDYYPMINRLFFINQGNGKVFIDEIYDVSEDIVPAPVPGFRYYITNRQTEERSVTVNFNSVIHNQSPDETYSWYWEFGDGNTSTEEHPVHIYNNCNQEVFKVLLTVKSSSGKRGFTTEHITYESVANILPSTVNFVGDVMLARTVGNIDPLLVFDSVRDVLVSADLSVANLESLLSNANTPHPTKPIRFQANPNMVNALTDAGIDIVSLANNHIYDYLYNGISQTQQVLSAHNILYSGAGINEYEASLPLMVNLKGQVLAFLASSDRNGSYNNYQPFLQAAYNKPGFYNLQPSSLKSQLDYVRDTADLKIVMMHAGSEYSLKPGADYDKNVPESDESDDSAPRINYPYMWDTELRHFAIDQGADIVIVHHPHIIQGFEVYQNKLIAHSLGNFVFDLSRADTKPSMILRTRINQQGFFDYEVIPVFLAGSLPRLIQDDAGLRILDYLVYRSREMNTCLLVDRDHYTGRVITDTLAYETYDALAEKAVSYPDSSLYSEPLLIKDRADFSQMVQISPDDNYQYRAGRSLMPFGAFENPDFYQWSLDNTVSYDSTVVFRGNYSMKMTDTPPADNVYLTSAFNHRFMNQLPATFYAKVNTSNLQSFIVTVKYYSNPGSDSYSSQQVENIPVNNNSIWQTVYFDLNIPENSQGFSVSIVIRGNGNRLGIAYIDDLDIIEWDPWFSNSGIRHQTPNAYYYLQLKKSGEQASSQVLYHETAYRPVVVPISEHDITAVSNVKLYQNYPNPFNPKTTIHFNLRHESKVELDIYNIKGQKVKSLINTELQAGDHYISWSGDNKSGKTSGSGIYFCVLKSGKEKMVKKMLLIK